VDDNGADGSIPQANADQIVQQDHGAAPISRSDGVRVVPNSLFEQFVPHAEGCGCDGTWLVCHALCRERKTSCLATARQALATHLSLSAKSSVTSASGYGA
jgi:hypothetical protein